MKQLSEKQKAGLAKGRAVLAAKRKAKAEAAVASAAPAHTVYQFINKLGEAHVPTPASAPEPRRRRTFNYKKYGLCALGALLIFVSVLSGAAWMADTTKTIMGILTVLLFGGGILLIVLAFKKVEVSTSRPPLRYGGIKTKGPANSITIYAKKDPANPNHLLPDCIKFEQLENPPGLKRRLRNDNQHYYVNIHDTTGLKDCILPDNQYCDPHRFLIPVQMKYSQEYYTPLPSLLQRLKPVLFIAVIAIGGIILAMVNTPPSTGS